MATIIEAIDNRDLITLRSLLQKRKLKTSEILRAFDYPPAFSLILKVIDPYILIQNHSLLYHAVKRRNTAIIQLLLEEGIDPNTENVLQIAIDEKLPPEIIQTLLDYGAMIDRDIIEQCENNEEISCLPIKRFIVGKGYSYSGPHPYFDDTVFNLQENETRENSKNLEFNSITPDISDSE